MDNYIELSSGVKYFTFRKSDGVTISIGDIIEVFYRVSRSEEDMESGKFIQSSWEEHKSIKFKVGNSEIVKGVEEGINGMNTFEERRILVPSHLAFGEKGVPGLIKPNEPLVYDLYIVGIWEE